MRVFSREELAHRSELIATNHFCQKPWDIADRIIGRLKPHEPMPLIEYSEKYRKFRKGDGTLTPWTRKHRAALLPLMRAHDNPAISEIVAPKPSRIGGTVIAENHALRMMHIGPSGRCLWYHNDPGGYSRKDFKDLWDRAVHPEPLVKLGQSPSDDQLMFKRFGPQYVELLKISNATTTGKEGEYVVMDEVDSYRVGWQYRFAEAARQRQAQIGSTAKRYFCSHPDMGWRGGIAQAWLETSQGILVAPCPECSQWASAYPTKHWPEVPRFVLDYDKLPEGAPVSERIDRAKATASIRCPHCGVCMGEEQRAIMADTCIDMHKGQVLDVEAGVIGEPQTNGKFGLWLHIFFSTQVSLSELAGRLEAAVEHFERTGKVDKIRDTMNRAFGEVFEGKASIEGLDARTLKARTKAFANAQGEADPMVFSLGEIPDGVKFLTLAIDVGGGRKPGEGGKFDTMVLGWDLDRRRYVIDRQTLKYRMHGDVAKPVFPTMVQDDWTVLEAEINRVYPFRSRPDYGLPIALTVIDIKDGNATPFGLEFLRRVGRKTWAGWPKVRGIMGAKSPDAQEVSRTAQDYNRGSDGSPIAPAIHVYNVGSSKLKEDVLVTLAVDNGAAGQWYFPVDLPDAYYEQFFNEVQVEGKWVRNGDNESLDLGGYGEAARQIISPDRSDKRPRDWTPGNEPIWARPVALHQHQAAQPTGGDVTTAQPASDNRERLSRFLGT